MLEHSYFSDFDDNDVIAFGELHLYKTKRIKDIVDKMCVEHIESAITTYLQGQNIHVYPDRYERWMSNGVKTEVLKLGSKQWQKGKIKIRISVEFYPDEPEVKQEPPSPLDDIRQSMS
jgi:hypothetical protein